jgi:4-hydroxy-tetrahydrodipicolinate synthase
VSGGVQLALANLALGGAGFGCAEGNVLPQVVSRLQAAFLAGDVEGAAADQSLLLVLSDLLARFGGVRCLKALMALLGKPMGQPRAPFLPLTAGQLSQLREAFAVVPPRVSRGHADRETRPAHLT